MIPAGILPQDVLVILDNGHGTRQYTKGKCSADGRYYEGEWSRMMVSRIAAALKELGFQTHVLVPEAQDVPLMTRVARANAMIGRAKYCFLLSVHTNADNAANLKDGWSNASGLCVYCANNASEDSRVLARNVYDAGVEMGLKGNRATPSTHYWTANFTIIASTRMPAILTESCFHTNRAEVDYLLSDKGQEDIVNYHVAGICRTFGIPFALCQG